MNVGMGLRPRSFISGNICFELSVYCLCSACMIHDERSMKRSLAHDTCVLALVPSYFYEHLRCMLKIPNSAVLSTALQFTTSLILLCAALILHTAWSEILLCTNISIHIYFIVRSSTLWKIMAENSAVLNNSARISLRPWVVQHQTKAQLNTSFHFHHTKHCTNK